MNEVLKDGSNKSPLLSSDAPLGEQIPAETFTFEDNEPNTVEA